MGHKPPPFDIAGRPTRPSPKPQDTAREARLVRGIKTIMQEDALRLDPEAYRRGVESGYGGKPDRIEVVPEWTFHARALGRWALWLLGPPVAVVGLLMRDPLWTTLGMGILGGAWLVFESPVIGKKKAGGREALPRVPQPVSAESIEQGRLDAIRELYATGQIEPQDLEVMIADVLSGEQPTDRNGLPVIADPALADSNWASLHLYRLPSPSSRRASRSSNHKLL